MKHTLFFLCVIAVLIISTFSFTIPRQCALLHTGEAAPNYQLKLSDGDAIGDLDYVTLNVLGASVEPNCNLVACSGPYFTGSCKTLSSVETLHLPSPWENILSINCTCTAECICGDHVDFSITNSCGRAYLFEGGCNRCHAPYFELKEGEENWFQDGFENNVTSLVVRPGCSLNVYDEEELEGQSSSVEGIIQNWTKPIMSYDCSCSSKLDNPSLSVTSEMPPVHYPESIDIRSSPGEIQELLRGGHKGHPGLFAAFHSHNANFSTHNAYILILGSVSSGKTSAMNILFPGLERSTLTSTKDIVEYRVSLPVGEFGMKNSELRVIDTPGMASTRDGNDATVLASLEEFLNSHEELRYRKPNVILIFNKFGDNAWIGQHSTFVRAIHSFDTLRGRLGDPFGSNVIYVFSQYTHEIKQTQRNPKSRLSAFEKAINSHSLYPSPLTLLVVAENKAQEQDLYMVNGHFKLPNREFYPKNLMDKIVIATMRGKDAIGTAIFESAFKSTRTFISSATIRFPTVDKNNSKVTEFLGILQSRPMWKDSECSSEVCSKLEDAFNSMPSEMKRKFPNAFFHLKTALTSINILVEADLPTTNWGIARLIRGIRLNEPTLYLLKEAFKLSPPKLNKNLLVGHGYNIFRDEVISSSPFDLTDLHPSPIGYQIRTSLNCKIEPSTSNVLRFFANHSDYVSTRISELKLPGNISHQSFNWIPKEGNIILSRINSSPRFPLYSVTAVKQFRVFKFQLNNKLKLSANFMDTLHLLPNINRGSCKSLALWKDFFNTFGTHVVSSVYAGGVIRINLRSTQNISFEGTGNFSSFFEFDSIRKSKAQLPEGIEVSLDFFGGDESFHISHFPAEKEIELLEKWKDSLSVNPAVLSDTVELIPFSKIISPVSNNLAEKFDAAASAIFNFPHGRRI